MNFYRLLIGVFAAGAGAFAFDARRRAEEKLRYASLKPGQKPAFSSRSCFRAYC